MQPLQQESAEKHEIDEVVESQWRVSGQDVVDVEDDIKSMEVEIGSADGEGEQDGKRRGSVVQPPLQRPPSMASLVGEVSVDDQKALRDEIKALEEKKKQKKKTSPKKKASPKKKKTSPKASPKKKTAPKASPKKKTSPKPSPKKRTKKTSPKVRKAKAGVKRSLEGEFAAAAGKGSPDKVSSPKVEGSPRVVASPMAKRMAGRMSAEEKALRREKASHALGELAECAIDGLELPDPNTFEKM